MTNAIISASTTSFPQTKEFINPRYNKPWWNQACAKAVESKRAAKRALIAHPSQANLINFKRNEALVKREVKIAKKASWMKYCSTITSDTPISELWRKIKRLQTPFQRKTQPFILSDSTIISDSSSKANALASQYKNVWSSPVPCPYPRHITLPLAVALNEEIDLPLNAPFQLHELEHCLHSLKSTSPGSDRVHNQHLVHLPLEFRTWLLEIFNQSLRTCTVPGAWKEAVIIPIPKPGKLLTRTSSYRPISLLSCVGKLMEAMVNKRLTYFLEQKQALRPSQGGFRCRMSAVDQVARLEAAIHSALHIKSVLLVCFVDLSSAFDKVWHTGLLYKLSRCGIRGSLLRWFQAYLSDRTFKVFFEGKYSSTEPIKSGVPQGAILSPTLFNVMMSDMPSTPGVSTAEYADDITFYVSHKNIQIATNLLQAQVNSFVEWTHGWGLKLNLEKTKTMCFTSKKIHPLPIKASGHNLEIVQQHRYLGVVLNAPCLRWKPHIEMLRISCLPILNLLKSISHRHWGADRQVLLKLYRVLLRSRLDYASPFYASAAQSHLTKLDVLQNSCLRIATGCRKTTPIITLEIETNIPPLKIHREQIMCKYYARLRQLPECPVTEELFSAAHSCPANTHCSFVPHTRAILTRISLPHPRFVASPLISPLPPWFNVDENILTNFNNILKTSLSPSAITQMFHDLSQSKYASCIAAYTDGSRVEEPTCSTAAALVIPLRGVSLNWKLRPEVQILESELFAILEALTWAQNNLQLNEKFVIFSDSQSSLFLIKNRKPKHYLPLVFEIQHKIWSLSSSHVIVLQFIPSHCGIPGNEAADLAARQAHALRYRTVTTSSREELVKSIDDAISVDWCTSWHNKMRRSGRGLFLARIKDSLGSWPWASHPSRVIETAVARLRTGHAGVRSHLARFGLAPDPLCSCGMIETIDHLLLECANHAVARANLFDVLTQLKVTPNLKNLLGGGTFPLPVQLRIVEALASFLHSSHIIKLI
jgi:ribonuclease HI